MRELAKAKIKEQENRAYLWISERDFLNQRRFLHHPTAWDYFIWRLCNELAEALWGAQDGLKADERRLDRNRVRELAVILAYGIEDFACQNCCLAGSPLADVFWNPVGDGREALDRCSRLWDLFPRDAEAFIPPAPRLADVFALAAYRLAVVPLIGHFYETALRTFIGAQDEDLCLLGRRAVMRARQFYLDAHQEEGKERICLEEPYRCGHLFFQCLEDCTQCMEGIVAGLPTDPRRAVYAMMPHVEPGFRAVNYIERLHAFALCSPWCMADCSRFLEAAHPDSRPNPDRPEFFFHVWRFASDWRITGFGKSPADLFVERQTSLEKEEADKLRAWADAELALYEVEDTCEDGFYAVDALEPGDRLKVLFPTEDQRLSSGDLILTTLLPGGEGHELGVVHLVEKRKEPEVRQRVEEMARRLSPRLAWRGRGQELMEARALQEDMARAFASHFGGELVRFSSTTEACDRLNDFLQKFIFDWKSVTSGLTPAQSFRLRTGFPPQPKRVAPGESADASRPIAVFFHPEIGYDTFGDLHALQDYRPGSEDEDKARRILTALLLDRAMPPQLLDHLRKQIPEHFATLLGHVLGREDLDLERDWEDLIRRYKSHWEEHAGYPCWLCVLSPDRAADAEEDDSEAGGLIVTP